METLRRQARVLARGTLPRLKHITQPDYLPGFQLDYVSGNKPFTVLVRARNTMAADAEGRVEMAANFPDFDPQDARLVGCVEVH